MAVWQIGDDPTKHPLWGDQVELEEYMMRAGAENYRAKVVRARQKDQMTSLQPYRALIKRWLPCMVEGLKDWKRDTVSHFNKRGGTLPISLTRLKDIDPYLAAFVTLRHTLNKLAVGHTHILGLASDIGLALEHEARMEAWEKRDKDLYHTIQRGLDRDKATAPHRRRVNINRFNKLMRDKLEWVDWSDYERQRVGLDLIDIMVRYTKQFSTGVDPTHIFRGTGWGKKAPIILQASGEVLDWLANAVDRAEIMCPQYMPTVMPPKRWEGLSSGAYYTEYVRTPPLIRFQVHHQTQRIHAAEEYDAIDMPRAYDALHTIQEVPWKINTRVLEVAKVFWERDFALAGLPLQGETPRPARPQEADEDEEVEKAWKREITRIRSADMHRLVEVESYRRTMETAQLFANRDRFYFPHMFDFRGRMYPIPTYLQPQGRDLSRGLLTFSKGKPVGAEGGGWLAIHLANVWGYDKASFDERIAWVEERETLWKAIAEDPIKNRQWCGLDDKGEPLKDPWQNLAAALEWARYLEEGDEMLSSLPLCVDGTCNGLQHLSAMVRDPVGGAAVNLIPADHPRDIYREVSQDMLPILKEIAEAGGEEGNKAQWWLDLTKWELPRSIAKRPVMIMPYGGTREAYFRYTREWLAENHPSVIDKEDKEDRSTIGKRIAFLVKHLWDTITLKVAGAVHTMKWLQDCARTAAVGNQPIFWRTPSGFVVRHFYGKIVSKCIKTKIDSQIFVLRLKEVTADLDTRAQLKGIAPNFVHSMDAAAMHIAMVSAWERGLDSLTAIHDAFGTVAADMWTLHHTIREAFIEVYSHDVLAEFRAICQEVFANTMMAQEMRPPEDHWMAMETADKKLPEPLEKGELDISKVAESDYFFA